MGGKTTGILGIVLGVVIGVIGAATGQPYLIFSAAMLIAGGAYSLAFSPKSPDQGTARQQDLQIATATVGNPVPVIFGTVRVTPNIIRYEEANYRIEAVEEEVETGGKGGDDSVTQVVGYNHFLQWEYGLCMGPVDSIGQILVAPGEVTLFETDDWTAFASDYIELSPDFSDAHYGLIRIYQGNATQARVTSGDAYSADGIAYRNVCWALMGVGSAGFRYGETSTLPTYQFLIRRTPVCRRDDGSIVLEIQTRGSSLEATPEYYQGNPAAIIYEILTNKVWGRGLSSDIIDEDSFALASEFFHSRNIGMSFTMEANEDISSVLEGIRRHVKTLILWDGEHYKLKVLMDIDVTHGGLSGNALRASDLQDLTISRPTWASTINELRAEWSNINRGYRVDMVHVQDLGNIEVQGGRLISSRIQLPAFQSLTNAYRQATRILSEMSFPYMTATWTMNRFKSRFEVGDVVPIVWDEFGENRTTTYWMIVSVDDGDSDSESISIMAVEDTLLGPFEGEEANPSLPDTHPWEDADPPPQEDVDKRVPPVVATDAPDWLGVFELPVIATKGEAARTVTLIDRNPGKLGGVIGQWSNDDISFGQLDAAGDQFGISGELVDALPGLATLDRGPGYVWTANLTNNIGKALEALLVDVPEDDFEDLMRTRKHLILIGDEIIQVGKMEQVSGTTLRMRNLIRGAFGTPVRVWSAATPCWYLAAAAKGFNTSQIAADSVKYFRAMGLSGWSQVTAPSASGQPYGSIYRGRGLRPLEPTPVECVDGGSTVTLTVRPRFEYGNAAGIASLNNTIKYPITSLGDMVFMVEQIDNAAAAIGGLETVGHTFTPPTLTAPGEVEITVAKKTGAIHFRVYSVRAGVRSVFGCWLSL